MATYELPPTDADAAGPAAPAPSATRHLPEGLLVRNVRWFCRFRWVVIAVLTAFGLLGLWEGLMARLDLAPPGAWPLVVAAVLVVENLAFLAHARRLRRAPKPGHVRANLWLQVAVDLVVLTVVVHFVGSLETYVPFAYLFHIVLACLFLARGASLLVTAAASLLYATCVALEETGVLPPASIHADPAIRTHMARTPWSVALGVASAVAIFLVVWYLASYLAQMVRRRDQELDETNRRLVHAQRERTRHLLRTTHELKAPFAAIRANTQLLLKGYCGDLPPEATQVVERIDARANRLAAEIQDMLQLANLRSEGRERPAPAEVDLADLIRSSIAHLEPQIGARRTRIETDLEAARVRGVEDDLKMMFQNLLANAVAYSHEGGRVGITCRATSSGGATATVEDEGIGIPPEKLPHIFEEYYRADEAVRHNRESSGLGLAIVRHVAAAHGIRVRVTSEPGAGTQVRLDLPGAPPGSEPPESRHQEGDQGWLT